MSTTDRDTTRIVRSWLDEGATRLPDRVLDAVLDQVPATPQRRAGWLARRFLPMNTYARLGLIAAAILAVAIVGIGLLGRNDVGPSPSVAPSAWSVLRAFPQTVTGVSAPRPRADPEGVAMAIGPDGFLYVTDLEHSVTVIDPATGQPVRSWGHSGTGDGEFGVDILGIAVAPSGQVYVADPANHRIQVFDANGTYLRQISDLGTAEGNHGGLGRFITVGADESVYASEWGENTVTKFDANGAVVWRVGGPDAADADLRDGVYALAVMKDGSILATFDAGGKAVLLDPATGAVTGHWRGGSSLGASGEPMVDATTGNVSVFQYDPAAIQVFDADGNLLGRVDRLDYDLYPAPVFARDGRGYSFNQTQGLVELQGLAGS